MRQPLSVIILAAGRGTRMKSRRAKVLHQAGGKSLIEHVVDAARQLTTPDSIYVVVGHQAREVEQLLSPSGVHFVLQKEQRGTGHAVQQCAASLKDRGGRILVLYGDVPLLRAATLKRLVEMHATTGAAAAAITTHLHNPAGYGRILRNGDGEVIGIVEEKAASDEQRAIREINAGIYCFSAEPLWRYLPSIQTNNPAGEYYLTDMVDILNRNGERVLPMVVDDPTELLGINTKIELAEVDRHLREQTARRWMLEGVTIERPETVTIDSNVTIGPDTVIEPFARILGNSVIGADCRISAYAIVEDSQLEDGVAILPYSFVARSYLEAGSQVGPFARLRFDNRLEAGAVVGNFVELKKTRIGRGAKAQHLSYLGDAAIGAKVNVGAGAITCNYDGKAKHRTEIADGAFIGSNATLVAPVAIGEGSYVAAGSVITGDVPADALALGRARQVVKEGWARRRREEAKQPVSAD